MDGFMSLDTGVLVFTWLCLMAAGVHSAVSEKESAMEKVSCVGVSGCVGVGECVGECE